ncbi:MAG TPA: short-chain dehydrogenase [Acidobacteria bacterium]|nr:short-chain dehydrogenase [Acidobacteriota bacterium]
MALVTGAGRGVGLEICRRLGAAGCTVVLTARHPERGAAAARSLREEGHDVCFRELDVDRPAAVRELAARVMDEHGRLDALINNAAISIDSAGLATLELEVLHRSFDTNFLGALGCCQAVLPFMLAAGHGRIVNVSSDHGSFPKLAAGNPGYRLSKTALNTLTVILADEVKEINVLVNAMTLGGSCEDPGAVASAAETAAWLATLPDDGPRGRFFRDRAEISW